MCQFYGPVYWGGGGSSFRLILNPSFFKIHVEDPTLKLETSRQFDYGRFFKKVALNRPMFRRKVNDHDPKIYDLKSRVKIITQT